MRKLSLLWVLLLILVALAVMAAPAASVALGGGGTHLACGASGGSTCG